MLSKHELESALRQIKTGLDAAVEMAERHSARNFRASEQHEAGNVYAPTTLQQVAFDAGYAKGLREAFPVLMQHVQNLKT